MNACEKCQAHDAETKRLMVELFHPDEVTFLTEVTFGAVINAVHAMKNQQSKLRRIGMSQKKGVHEHLQAQATMDFCATILGKFISVMTEERVDELNDRAQRGGVRLNIQHEACPHVAAAGAP